MRKPWYSWLYVRSPITKIVLGILSVLISFGGLLAQRLMEPARMAAQGDSWEGRTIEKGAEIYSGNCYTCHGLAGQGGIGVAPPLLSKHFFTERMKEVGFAGSLHDYIALTVAAGRPVKSRATWANNMPTWGRRYGGQLRDDQVEQVTQFVLNWESTAMLQTPEEDLWYTIVPTATTGIVDMTAPTEPQVVFVQNGCSGCHKLGDQYTVGVTGPDLNTLHETAATKVPDEDAETYVYNSIVEPNKFINEGFAADIMPKTFKDQLGEENIRKLVTWLLDPNRTY
jgi:mono/diheme cytochrome c family protein/cytochrome c551/c552